MQAYYDKDADPSVLEKKRIAVIGYGSQGNAQARCLADSGLDVVVGLREGSSSAETVKGHGHRCEEHSGCRPRCGRRDDPHPR